MKKASASFNGAVRFCTEAENPAVMFLGTEFGLHWRLYFSGFCIKGAFPIDLVVFLFQRATMTAK